MKIWRVLIVMAVFVAACSDSDDGAATSTAPSTSAVPVTTAPTTAPATTTTLLPPLEETVVDAVPDVDAVASSTCEWFDADGLVAPFVPASCEDNGRVSIESVTFVCETGDCEERLEVVIETAEEFTLDSLNLFEAVDIRLVGADGTLECAVRNTFAGFELGCLDADLRLTVPPEDVWLNGVDGLRHVFGSGAAFVGEVESVTVVVTRLGADNAGPIGSFTVLDPTLPGRITPSRSVVPAIVDRTLDRVLSDLVPMSDDVRECVRLPIVDGADLEAVAAAAGHGLASLPDDFLATVAAGLDECQPILGIYEASLENFELPTECVSRVSEALAQEFGWLRVLQNSRERAQGVAGQLEQQAIQDEFTLERYEEFGCLDDS